MGLRRCVLLRGMPKNKGLNKREVQSPTKFLSELVADNMMKFEIFYFIWSQNCVFSLVCSCLFSGVAHIVHTLKPFSNFAHFNFVLYLSNNNVRLPRECFDLDKTFYLEPYVQKIPLWLWKGAYLNWAEHEKSMKWIFPIIETK